MGQSKEHEVTETGGGEPKRYSKNRLVEAIGWYGTAAIVGAYVLVSFDVIDSTDAWYQGLNLTGAIGIVAVSWTKRAMQPAVLNVIWSAVALVALLRIAF